MAPSEQLTALALQELLKDAALAGEWILDPSRSTVSLKSRSMWGLARVNGVFRQVTGNGEVSGAITMAAASIDTKNTRRDTHLHWLTSSTAITIRISPSPLTASGPPVRASPSPVLSASVTAPGP